MTGILNIHPSRIWIRNDKWRFFYTNYDEYDQVENNLNVL